MIEKLITALPGIGPRLKPSYERLKIKTIEDLLFAFPYRYDDFRNVEGIATVKPGMQTTIEGTVASIRSRRSPKKRMNLAEATIEDGTGSITAIWFHQSYIAKQLRVGMNVSLSGKIDDKYGLSIVNPQFEVKKPGAALVHTGRLLPVYSVSGRMAQKGRRNIIRMALSYIDEVEEWIPANVLEKYDLISIKDAIPEMHYPEEVEKWEKALRRIKFGELLLHQIAHVRARHVIESVPGIEIPIQEEMLRDMVKELPFELTTAQRKAAFQVVQDMSSGKPMHRLLEGDVGSGKTVVAALVIANVVAHKKQSAYLAPTEILAVQQDVSLREHLGANATVVLLTGQHQRIDGRSVTRQEVLDAIVDGRADVIVGTHALLTAGVDVRDLAFVVIDEQHRFGVEQRKQLLKPRADGTIPHLLSMTATPIPRTLAMTLYGDMRVSILDELPPGRGKIETIYLESGQDDNAYGLMRQRLSNGAQAYVVCPFIEDSDLSEAESVKALSERLKKGALRSYKVEALHGRLKPKEKAEIMDRFTRGETHVLVSTTVIEVGVNVPNATVMFIEGAERFGLAQLHQLRGRVRRSTKEAVCFLHPSTRSQNTMQRLGALVKYDNGFKLAEIDLQLRGSGDRFGTRQHGEQEFKYASLADHALIAQAREAAELIIEKDEVNTISVIDNRLEQLVGTVA